MPHFARFLSCSFTGLLLSLTGFLTAAYLYEGTQEYWQSLGGWLGTTAFWYLTGLFGLLTALALLISRLLVRIWRLTDGAAGLVAGTFVPLLFALVLAAAQASYSGGWPAVAHKLFPAAFVLALPFALSGAFTAWLWDRLG